MGGNDRPPRIREPERGVVFTCEDRAGREVVLYEDTWHDHVLAKHPELAGFEWAVRAAIEHPEHIRIDRTNPSARCYYRLGDLPPPDHNTYVRVVAKLLPVGYDLMDRAVVATAYLVPRLVPGEGTEW